MCACVCVCLCVCVSGRMGVSGLLQLLQPATVGVHVAAYKGKRVAVDAYCWLHKGAYACAYELAIGAKTDL